MKIITRSEMVWDKNLQQYIVVAEESYEYEGPVAECKKGGGKGIIGLVGALAIPFAAPAIGAAMGVSSTVAGAAMGAGLGLLSGGGVKGALLGGLGGGLSGYMAGGGGPVFGSGEAGITSTGGSSVFSGAADGSFTIDPTNLGAGGSSFSGTIAGDIGAGFGYGAGASLGLAPNIGQVGTAGGPLLSGFSGATSAMPAAGDIFSAFNPMDLGQGGLSSLGSTGPTSFTNMSIPSSDIGGTGITNLGDSAGAAVMEAPVAGGAEGGGILSGIKDKILGNKDALMNAGIKAGAQYLGNVMTPTPQGLDMGSMNSYLQDQNALGREAFEMNKEQFHDRNKSAEAVENIAANYDPQYLGRNAEAKSKNRDMAAWQDTEARMRAQGYTDNQINAEKNRYMLGASQNSATAYTGGVDAGYKSQTGMYATGAGIRQDINAPGAGNIDAMMRLYDQNSKDKQYAGKSIEQIFEPIGNTTTTGAEDTRNRRTQPE